jgi:hypothetical protein
MRCLTIIFLLALSTADLRAAPPPSRADAPAAADGPCEDVFMPEFPAIRLVQPCQEPLLPRYHRESWIRRSHGTIVPMRPGSPGYDALVAGLRKTRPEVRQAVLRVCAIDLVKCGSDGQSRTGAETYGSTIIFNACDFRDAQRHALLTQNVVHEATHAYAQLIDSVTGQRAIGCGPNAFSLSEWPLDTVAAALETVTKFGLQDGLENTFAGFQKLAVGLGFPAYGAVVDYGTYRDQSAKEAALRDGFANGYGASSVCEDLASMVAAVQAPVGIEDGLCRILAAAPSPLRKRLGLAYAKIAYLAAIGLVDRHAFAACVGPSHLNETALGFTVPP